MLIKVILSREKKIKIIEMLYHKALVRKNELMTWVSHSTKFTMSRKVRICE